jgi:hypothetical protein
LSLASLPTIFTDTCTSISWWFLLSLKDSECWWHQVGFWTGDLFSTAVANTIWWWIAMV